MILYHCPPGMSLRQRLEHYTMPVTESGCWIWLGSATKRGYGQIHQKIDGKAIAYATHRLSWEICRGPIPHGALICHTCDIRTCINPDHLFLGTAADNINDCIKKGRRTYDNRGTLNPRAKLCEEDVRKIRASNDTIEVLAEIYGVHNSQISRIRLGKTWKSV